MLHGRRQRQEGGLAGVPAVQGRVRPEGGDGGGQIIAEGTPSEVCKNKNSYTGKFLKDYL